MSGEERGETEKKGEVSGRREKRGRRRYEGGEVTRISPPSLLILFLLFSSFLSLWRSRHKTL